MVLEGTETLPFVCSQSLGRKRPKLEVSSNDPASLRGRTQAGGPGAPAGVRCLLCWFCILKRTKTFPACSGEHIPAISFGLFSLACTVTRDTRTQKEIGHMPLCFACGSSVGLGEPGRVMLLPHFLPSFSAAGGTDLLFWLVAGNSSHLKG